MSVLLDKDHNIDHYWQTRHSNSRSWKPFRNNVTFAQGHCVFSSFFFFFVCLFVCFVFVFFFYGVPMPSPDEFRYGALTYWYNEIHSHNYYFLEGSQPAHCEVRRNLNAAACFQLSVDRFTSHTV